MRGSSQLSSGSSQLSSARALLCVSTLKGYCGNVVLICLHTFQPLHLSMQINSADHCKFASVKENFLLVGMQSHKLPWSACVCMCVNV